MRLNEKTYPAYAILESGLFEKLQIDQMFGNGFLKTSEDFFFFLNSLKTTFKAAKHKYYLTNPFKDAITTAMPKIMDDDKHYHNTPTDCGVIFTDKGFSVYISNPDDAKIKLCVWGFTREALTTYGYIDNEGRYGGIACSLKDSKPYDDQARLADYLNSLLVSLYFIHNCEIETKVLEPNAKLRHEGEKHFNESKSNLIILDCRWFTELIRDTKFHVRGHLRWQVYGERNSKRKLKWIDEFEKHGYHRKASKS